LLKEHEVWSRFVDCEADSVFHKLALGQKQKDVCVYVCMYVYVLCYV